VTLLSGVEDAAQANTGLGSRPCRLFLIFLPFLPVGCPCNTEQGFLEASHINNWDVSVLFNMNWYCCINLIQVTESLWAQAISEWTFTCARCFPNTGEESSKELRASIICNDTPTDHQAKRY